MIMSLDSLQSYSTEPLEIRSSNDASSLLRNVGVWAPILIATSWNNQQLLEDAGLVPYLFHKVYEYDATMLGCKDGEYPSLDILQGLRMEFLPDCANLTEHLNENIRYLHMHYSEMDLLILCGPYDLHYLYLQEYRKLRPDGKVYLALDANSHWMDRIEWTEPEFVAMLDSCDVIATSCRKMWQHLNKKWNRCVIEYIPNGFFNPTGNEVNVTYDQKENILLTVGRIETYQKANHILLEAFSIIYDEFPDWNLNLVGSIDDSFQSFIDEYFFIYPELRDRVRFTGLIEDRIELFAEYARAKIFVMTSILEGGVPNVIAESLYHGCYQITSEIDAVDDIICNGEIGKSFPINDVSALVEVLREVLSNEEIISSAFPKILDYAHSNFDGYLIIKRLHHLLYGY